MPSRLEIFRTRLYGEFLPTYCNHYEQNRKRFHHVSGFKDASVKISDYDADNFLRAIENDVVQDDGSGHYYCVGRSSKTHIFWTGKAGIDPAPLTLSIEPIITFGAVARLVLDYGWPREFLGLEPDKWSLDFAVFEGPVGDGKRIGGEAKSTVKKLNTLISDLHRFQHLSPDEFPNDKKSDNSLRKWKALQADQIPLFWAVGPDGYSKLFEVDYRPDGKATLTEIPLERLAAN